MPGQFEMEFRKATEVDIDQLVRLRIKQLVDEGYPETNDIRKDLERYFSESLENGSLVCWVGIVNDTIVSTAALCFYRLPSTFSNPSGRIAYVTNMYTAGAYRRQGIASYLLQTLIEEARDLNYTSIRLHASSHGRGIYEKVGFSDTDGFMGMRL